MGAVTVITSGKGGVGKSTVSVGIARALSQRGRRVLMVDCDAGLRSLDRLTGIEEKLVYDMSDVVCGRCAPIEAIYPCDDTDRLFLMPAPASGEDMVKSEVMLRLVSILRQHFDHVIMDCPAGIGEGFRAACRPADRALIVCNPEPVSVRSAANVDRLLQEMNITGRRLVINRFSGKVFDKIKSLKDLDAVIDETGVRLLGVVPEDTDMTASYLSGEEAPKGCKGILAVSRIAGRLEGERIPVVLK